MKISYDLDFIAIGDVMATCVVFLCTRSFFEKSSTEYVPAIIASIEAKFEQILRAFSKYFHN